MRVSIIRGHPTPGGLNHAIAATAASSLGAHGHVAVMRDLDQEPVDPVLPAEIATNPVLPPEVVRHFPRTEATP